MDYMLYVDRRGIGSIEAKKVGETLLVTVGHKGKYAGVLAIYPDEEKEPFRYELVDLDRHRFKHDPAMDEVMREDGEIFVLEGNANPNLSHHEDFADSAEAAGMSYEDLLNRILQLGMTYPAPWTRA